jgi:GcrA cell cycle regulator
MVADLKARHAQGWRYAAIAAELAEKYGAPSLNLAAVSGKVFRLKMSNTHVPAPKIVPPKPDHPKRITPPKPELEQEFLRYTPSTGLQVVSWYKAAAPAAEDLAIPAWQRRSLQELREGDCRWPVGEVGKPEFFFCGGGAEPGCSYCARHSLVARYGRFYEPSASEQAAA